MRNPQSPLIDLMQMGLLSGRSPWVEAVVLAGLFALVLVRREHIVNWRMYRFAYLSLAAAVLVPPLVLAAVQLEPGAFAAMGSDKGMFGRLLWSLALNGLGPFFLAASIVCAFSCVMPRTVFTEPTPAAPQKHPLD